MQFVCRRGCVPSHFWWENHSTTPPLYEHNLTLAPYVWDISSKDNHTKPVQGFWFTSLIKGGLDTRGLIQSIRELTSTKNSISGFLAKQRERIASEHPQLSRYASFTGKILDVVETEAKRRFALVEEAEELLNEALSVVNDIYYGVRPLTDPDTIVPNELWLHQNVIKIYAEGRKAAGSWRAASIHCPWQQ